MVGNLIYYRYMNPAIVAPDGFNIIDVTAGAGGLNADQRRNLGCIAKVLQFASTGKAVSFVDVVLPMGCVNIFFAIGSLQGIWNI